MSKIDSGHLDELLDWLADEVAARLRTRTDAVSATARSDDQPAPASAAQQPAPDELIGSQNMAASLVGATWERGPEVDPPGFEPEIAGLPSHTTQLLSRLAIGLLVAVILINLPLFPHGAALARMIPSSASVVVRNGLLVKASDKPEVYVYQDRKFRWVSDVEAFQYYGYQWKNVQEVPPGFLADYEVGRPLYLVAKCPNSPHIYQLKNGVKHWIVDIPTFAAQGYQWSDVQSMDCATLSAMPMGETIPPGQGPAPQP